MSEANPAVQPADTSPFAALSGDYGLLETTDDPQTLRQILRRSLLWSACGAAIFGIALGSYAFSPAQIVASAIKLPLLLLGATALCFPAFFVLQSLLTRRPISLLKAAALQSTALTAIALIWASFSLPLFFLVATTHHYRLAKLLALVVGTAGGLVGFGRLRKNMIALCDADSAKRLRKPLLLYTLLYGVVGAQLAWVLRPFVGSPSLGFQLFRGQGGNIFVHTLRMLGLGG